MFGFGISNGTIADNPETMQSDVSSQLLNSDSVPTTNPPQCIGVNEIQLSSEIQSPSNNTRLYDLAKERLRRAEERRKSIPHGCTFKPELETHKSKKGKDETLESSNGRMDSSDEFNSRFDKLYQDAQDRDNRLALTSLRMSMEVPFKPKISKKAATVQSSFEDRLKSAEERLANRQKSMREKTENEVFAECTFTPTFAAKKRSSSSESRRQSLDSNSSSNNNTNNTKKSVVKSVGKAATVPGKEAESFEERLERTQQLRQKKLEALKKEREAEERAAVRATPQLVTRSSSRGTVRRSSGVYVSGEKDANGQTEAIHERLYNAEQTRQKRLEELKLRVESEMGVMFKPTLTGGGGRSKHPRSSVGAGAGAATKGESESVDGEGDPSLLETASASESTGHVSASSPSKGALSVAERGKLHVESRERKLEMLRLQKDEEERKELSFSPNLIARPLSRGKLRSSTGSAGKDDFSPGDSGGHDEEWDTRPVHERLVMAEKERQRRLAVLRDKAELESSQQMTFHPHVNHDNDANFGNYKAGEGEGTIFDRLAGMTTSSLRAHLGEISAKPDPEATFKPLVRKSSFGATNRVRDNEKGDVFDRLVHANIGKPSKETEERANAELTHQPKINSASRSLSASRSRTNSTPIHERLYQHGEKQIQQKEKLAKEKERLEDEACTFSPVVPEDSRNLAGNSSKPVWDRLAPNEQDITTARQKNEDLKKQRELEECTFQPVVVSTRPNSAGRVGSERGEVDWDTFTASLSASGSASGTGVRPGSGRRATSPSATATRTSGPLRERPFSGLSHSGPLSQSLPLPTPTPPSASLGSNTDTTPFTGEHPSPPEPPTDGSHLGSASASSASASGGEDILARLDQIERVFTEGAAAAQTVS